jgi:hypothetical protein
MRNINGAHATGDDFFGREPELLRLVRTLLNDSVLLSAPRRVGKSSLILRLQELLRSGFQSHSLRQLLDEQGLLKPILELTSVPIFINVEDCTSELEFAKSWLRGCSSRGIFVPGCNRNWEVSFVPSWNRLVYRNPRFRGLTCPSVTQQSNRLFVG